MTPFGLILDAVGVIVIFFATLEVRSQLILNSHEENAALARIDRRRNLLHRLGLLLLLSFGFQIVGMYS